MAYRSIVCTPIPPDAPAMSTLDEMVSMTFLIVPRSVRLIPWKRCGHLLLECVQEGLLAGGAVEVRVGVAEA